MFLECGHASKRSGKEWRLWAWKWTRLRQSDRRENPTCPRPVSFYLWPRMMLRSIGGIAISVQIKLFRVPLSDHRVAPCPDRRAAPSPSPQTDSEKRPTLAAARSRLEQISFFLANFAKFWRARSRLYQNEILQENNKICVSQHLSSSTRFAYFCTAAITKN